jgi:hypothetical protein
MILMNTFAGYPGSCHDQRVLTNSALWANSAAIFEDGSYLLADAGYACQSWLVAAFRKNNMTPAQQRFNRAHASCRNVIERTFGVLKGRWRILLGLNVMDMTLACYLIQACCQLHNLCIRSGVQHYTEVEANPEEEDGDGETDVHDDEEGRNLRNDLLHQMCS